MPDVSKNTGQAIAALPSPWHVFKFSNELTREVNITAIDGYGDQSIVVRRIGRKLDCYVTTGKFLETTENMHSRRSLVKYKFDEGNIVRQSWIISGDNTALFFPGNPTAFLQKLGNSKRFVIEYAPTDMISETASFDVSSLPSELSILGVRRMRVEADKTRK
jgi:hypothetical protein